MAEQRKNRHYTDDFKQEALRLAVRGDKSLTQVAEDLGIRRDLLQRWKREVRLADQDGQRAFPGHGKPRDEEMAQLRKELAQTREERDILKKALAFFSRTSR